MSKDEEAPPRYVRGLADYSVGYGKPPRHSQYKPGQSGNPKGRPKGARNKPNEGRLAAIVFQEMAHPLPVTVDGKRQPMAAGQAAVRRTFLDAAQGKVGSQRLAAELVREAEHHGRKQADDFIAAVTRYQRAWREELLIRSALKMTGPDPLPHPDDVVVDFKSGRVFAIGPMTAKQKALRAEGGPASENVPSEERPYEFTGTQAEICLFRALPDERLRVPIPEEKASGGLAAIVRALDALAAFKALLANPNLSEETRDNVERILKNHGIRCDE